MVHCMLVSDTECCNKDTCNTPCNKVTVCRQVTRNGTAMVTQFLNFNPHGAILFLDIFTFLLQFNHAVMYGKYLRYAGTERSDFQRWHDGVKNLE